jgi:hypothetical protein
MCDGILSPRIRRVGLQVCAVVKGFRRSTNRGLFAGGLGLFSGDMGLFAGGLGLFSGDMGLFAGGLGLFSGDMGLIRGYLSRGRAPQALARGPGKSGGPRDAAMARRGDLGLGFRV